MTFEATVNVSAFKDEVYRQAAPIIEHKLSDIRTFIIDEFNAPKSGRTYVRPRGTHRASAPGEPPAIDTGTLKASISQPKVGREGNAVIGRLEIRASYAGYLERGTARIAPRPFVRPAVEEILRRRA